MGGFACSVCAEPWGFRWLRTASWLQSCGTYEWKLYWLLERGVYGPHPSCGSLKSWGTRCEVQTICSSWRSWELRLCSQLQDTLPGAGFMERVFLRLSYPCRCGCSFICSMCMSCLLVSGSFRARCSTCSCIYDVPVGGEALRSFLFHHLSQLSSIFNYFHYFFC